MDEQEVTLASMLRDCGYRTGLFGKWHLGDTYPFRPDDRGFDETVWHLGGGIGQPGDHPDNIGRESYFDPVLRRNGRCEKFKGYCTDVFTGEAIDFIRRQRGGPWFAYVAYNAPHGPLQVDSNAAARFASRGATGDLAAYYAMVGNIDDNIGRLMECISKEGLSHNTVVVFTSDHGPCPTVCDGEGNPPFNAGLRGQKGSVYEGGIRVPSLWRGVGISKGRTITEPTHAIDILPTFLAMTGEPIRTGAKMDGCDISPLLAGTITKLQGPERALFLQWHRGDVPVPRRNAAVITRDRKWISVSEAGPEELFNIEADPSEKRDLAIIEPNTIDAMRAQYEAWLHEVSGEHRFTPVPIPLSKDGVPLRLTRQDWRVLGEDGWGASTKGRWFLRVDNPGEYEVMVCFDKAPGGRGSVFLCAGIQREVQPTVPGKAEYLFRLLLSLGSTELSAGWQTLYAEASPFSIELRPLHMPAKEPGCSSIVR